MNALTLKLIAVITMVIDHAGSALLSQYIGTENAGIYFATRYIGRIAFPIFAYLIAQGCVHTRSMGKYALRLGVLALISEPFFDTVLVRGDVNFLANTNIFYTLFLAVCAIWLHKLLGGGLLGLLAVIPAALAAHLLTSDYGAFGVLFIFALYVINPTKRLRAAAGVAIGMLALYLPRVEVALFAVLASLCILAYNGKQGPKHPALKYGFYAFYPAHLLIIGLIV